MSNLVWSEEIRPQTLSEIIDQPAVAVLEAFVRHRNVVDITLSGPPGCGKTTAVKAMARELYGEAKDEHGVSYYDTNFTTLNASDERGIDIVRGKITNFTTDSATCPEVPFRVIFLDEADKITSDAQDALRATMEAHSDKCRFVMSCNNQYGLSEALQSRGPIIPFFPLTDSGMTKIVIKACTKYSLTITEDALALLISSCRGDMRALLKKLQLAAMLSPNITKETLTKFIHDINDAQTEKILEFILQKDFANARALLIELYATAHYDSNLILSSLSHSVEKYENKFPNPIAFLKAQSKIGECSKYITQSINPLYLLTGLISDLILLQQIPLNCVHIREG